MTSTTETHPAGDPVLALRAGLDGALTLPGDNGWELAARAWNLSVAQRPRAVLAARVAADVVTAVRFARDHSLQISAQPSGHGATGALDETILIRTAAFDDVWIDADARVARVGSGVTWAQLQSELDGTGLTGLIGSSPDVTVVGSCLGGGLSWLSRPFGTGASSLRAVELVDASGRHRWVSDDKDPELMWALRGGGGDFGIVTAVELDLFPAPRITGGRLVFPAEQAAQVLRAFTAVTSLAPDTLSLWAAVMHFPPLPFLPEEIRGRSFCFVDAVHVGGRDELATLLAPVRQAGTVLRETVRPLRPSEIGTVCEEPAEPSPATHTAMGLSVVDDEVIDRILRLAGPGTGTPLTQVQIRHLGAALRRPVAGAAGRIDAEYLVSALAMLPEPTLAGPVAAAMTQLREAMAPWDAGPTVLSMLGPHEEVTAAFDEPTLARLRRVKATVDPSGVIRGNYPLAGK
ncbi:FAD-binding oxidoreductase [Nocardia bhagyanarayanae]|uniref:FAD/FMN-containing dehydrogenase n=1 Tax=Nocardia bhagyanarayanae TaxID=1215925 RepID=A0A543FHB8_9NOCA|nr:FAD-binding oxidoreductase [Nocardia bhagyanarayanae]TQM33257.1 FAD/FMN-containing dehydrogenase [Nocardia bhagyanarayanae]